MTAMPEVKLAREAELSYAIVAMVTDYDCWRADHAAVEVAAILKVVQAGVSHTRIGLVFAETFRAQRRHLGLAPSAACWALNWAKYGRRKLIGLA